MTGSFPLFSSPPSPADSLPCPTPLHPLFTTPSRPSPPPARSLADSLAWAVSEMQGWRLTMEDAHAGILDLGERDKEGKKTSFFAVFDGHGGAFSSFFSSFFRVLLAVRRNETGEERRNGAVGYEHEVDRKDVGVRTKRRINLVEKKRSRRCPPSLSPILTLSPPLPRPAGSTVAKFAGDTVHHRLAANEAFKKRDWEAAMKRAYLETDEDLRASASSVPLPLSYSSSSPSLPFLVDFERREQRRDVVFLERREGRGLLEGFVRTSE